MGTKYEMRRKANQLFESVLARNGVLQHMTASMWAAFQEVADELWADLAKARATTTEVPVCDEHRAYERGRLDGWIESTIVARNRLDTGDTAKELPPVGWEAERKRLIASMKTRWSHLLSDDDAKRVQDISENSTAPLVDAVYYYVESAHQAGKEAAAQPGIVDTAGDPEVVAKREEIDERKKVPPLPPPGTEFECVCNVKGHGRVHESGKTANITWQQTAVTNIFNPTNYNPEQFQEYGIYIRAICNHETDLTETNEDHRS
jgi:hypothetical protein